MSTKVYRRRWASLRAVAKYFGRRSIAAQAGSITNTKAAIPQPRQDRREPQGLKILWSQVFPPDIYRIIQSSDGNLPGRSDRHLTSHKSRLRPVLCLIMDPNATACAQKSELRQSGKRRAISCIILCNSELTEGAQELYYKLRNSKKTSLIILNFLICIPLRNKTWNAEKREVQGVY